MIAVKMADKNALKLTGMKRGIKRLTAVSLRRNQKAILPGCVDVADVIK